MMTRETKIGLLVGLAFIIVIGILLSDHLTTSTEPPQARLAQAGAVARQGASTPGSDVPPVTTIVAPDPVIPQAQVPTAQDLAQQHSAPPQTSVSIGPGQAQPAVTIRQTTPAPAVVVQHSAPPVEVATTEEVVGADQPPLIVDNATGVLREVALQNGEELVVVNGQSFPGAKRYKAEPGDTLSRLAGRFLGANTKANREAIMKANPSLQQDPDKIVAGRTYIIPAPAGATVPTRAALVAPPVVSQPEYWYTVKEGDSLWKIASEQLGTPAAVSAIKELNQDTLKGTDTVYPNMKLRLPAKPLAMAR